MNSVIPYILFLLPIMTPKTLSTERIASSGEYSVDIQIQEQSAMAILTRTTNQAPQILAQSEDIIPKIEKLVPRNDALPLAIQITKREITKNGGPEKAQLQINTYAKQFGNNFYNYLTPLSIEAYQINGVTIPTNATTSPKKENDSIPAPKRRSIEFGPSQK